MYDLTGTLVRGVIMRPSLAFFYSLVISFYHSYSSCTAAEATTDIAIKLVFIDQKLSRLRPGQQHRLPLHLNFHFPRCCCRSAKHHYFVLLLAAATLLQVIPVVLPLQVTVELQALLLGVPGQLITLHLGCMRHHHPLLLVQTKSSLLILHS